MELTGESSMGSPTVFVSYSSADESWKERLVEHLRVLEQEGLIDVWDDSRIAAGADWQPEIEAAISRAQVAVLLITASFLTSEFIRGQEVPRLLERRLKGGLRIIPVIVRRCTWKKVGWLAAMQCWPPEGRTLSEYSEHEIDAFLAGLAEEVNVPGAEPDRLETGCPARPQRLKHSLPRRLWFASALLALLLVGLVGALWKPSLFDSMPEDLGCSPDREQSKTAYAGSLEKGKNFLKSYNLPDASDSFRTAACAQDRPEARIAYAEVLAELGDLGKARRIAERARSLKPTPEEKMRIEALTLASTGYLHRAVKIYADLLERAPHNLDSILALANAQIAAGDSRAALETIAPVAATQDRRIALAQARAYHELSEYQHQLDAASLAIAEEKKYPLIAAKGHLMHAIALSELQRNQEASGELNEAAKLAAANEPLSAEILIEQGSLQINLGNYREALRLFGSLPQPMSLGQAGALRPAVSRRQNRAVAHLILGDITLAQRQLERAYGDLGDENLLLRSDIANTLGYLLLQTGDLWRARGFLTEAIHFNERDNRTQDEARALCNRAQADRLLMSSRSPQADLGQCKKLADLSAVSTLGLETEGDFALSQGELDRAMKKRQEALAVSQDDKEGTAVNRFALSTILLEKGQPAAAESQARQALEYFEAQQEQDYTALAWLALAQIHLAQRNLPAALRESKRAETRAAVSDILELRVRSALTAARVADAEKRIPDALAAAKRALAEAESHDHPAFRLEALLVLGQLEIEHPDPAALNRGCDRLRKVEDDAKAGYPLVAQKAHRSLANARTSCPEPE
jgi:tetratricopeptide (TPR) repeat protein